MKSKKYYSLCVSLMRVIGLANTAYSADYTNSIGMEFKNIPAGSDDGYGNEKPVHSVRISAFQMGVHEVTVGQFRQFIDAAEWEYAARAGTKTEYSWGDSKRRAGAYAWYDDNSGGRAHTTGRQETQLLGFV